VYIAGYIRLTLSILLVLSGCTYKKASVTPKDDAIYVLDLQGKTRSFDDYLGSPTLLILWASWCQECVAELNTLNTATRLLGAQEVQLIAVAIQDELESIKSLPQTSRAIFRILLDIKGELLERYPAEGLPTAYLIDRIGRPVPLIDPEDGQIKRSIIGLRNWQSALGQKAIAKSLSLLEQ
jgi:peroxiredoxin